MERKIQSKIESVARKGKTQGKIGGSVRHENTQGKSEEVPGNGKKNEVRWTEIQKSWWWSASIISMLNAAGC